ncbi:hypothetical protein B0H11DRAFT_2036238 [Mycena galericulata]|nr:hypothetical protein B0H11DRAFT_2036238 [Mycena galericulata]
MDSRRGPCVIRLARLFRTLGVGQRRLVRGYRVVYGFIPGYRRVEFPQLTGHAREAPSSSSLLGLSAEFPSLRSTSSHKSLSLGLFFSPPGSYPPDESLCVNGHDVDIRGATRPEEPRVARLLGRGNSQIRCVQGFFRAINSFASPSDPAPGSSKPLEVSTSRSPRSDPATTEWSTAVLASPVSRGFVTPESSPMPVNVSQPPELRR